MMHLADWAGLLLMAVPGVSSLFYGLLCMYAPQQVFQGASASNTTTGPEGFFLAHRTSTGLCLVAGGVFCLASVLYVWLRLNS
jgi:hypothetical protein